MKRQKWLYLILPIILCLSGSSYGLDYRLSGIFLVEAFDVKRKRTNVQIWHLEFGSRVPEHERGFTDFSLVAIDVATFAPKKYRVRGINTFENEPEDLGGGRKGVFLFEFGTVIKTRVKLVFRDDGSLGEMGGSTTNLTDPAAVITYSLIKEEREIVVVADNYEYVTRHKR